MKPILLFLLLAVLANAKTIYVTQAGAGSTDGSSLANAFSASKFNTSGNWGSGAGKISPADTVILSGTFTVQLVAQASGTSANAPTIFKGDGTIANLGPSPSWTGTTKIPGFSFGANSYLSLYNCEITQTSTAYVGVQFNGASYNIVQGNYIHHTSYDGIDCVNGTTNSFNVIRANWLYDINGFGGGINNATCIAMQGNSNLIEYNAIGLSEDRSRCFGVGNIVRNNYWGYTDTPLYPNGSQNPSHTDGFQSFQGGLGLSQIMYERNYDTDNTDSVGGTNAHAYLIQDSVGTYGFTWAVNRFNICIRPGGSAGAAWQNMSHTFSYNNTLIASSKGASNIYGSIYSYTYPSTYSAATSDLADVRNVLLAFSPNAVNSPRGPIDSLYLPTNFTNGTNLFYNTVTQANYPSGASPANLSHSDPLFTDGTGVAGHDNYTLTGSSPAKAAGSAYVKAAGAGSTSTSLTVNNAQALFDGWGVADADWIKIGSGSYVQISSIDYDTDVVTLSAARSWADTDSVIVKGMEDVGALPYDYAAAASVPTITATTSTANPTTLSATTTTVESVRKVEFVFNGIPVLTVNYTGSSPLSGSYIPSGIGTLETRAYNFWASATPTVSTFQLINQDPSALGATAVSPAQINLAWTDNSAGADSFSIERSANGTTGWAEIGTTAATVVTYQSTGLAANTAYYYRVRAYSGGVYSSYTSNANATTQSSTPFSNGLRVPASLGGVI